MIDPWRRKRMLPLLALAVVVCVQGQAFGRHAPDAAPPAVAIGRHPDWPHANPSDVSSIPAIVSAFASAVSLPAGQKLDQDRLRSLFVPDGRIVIGLVSRHGRPSDVILLSPERYAALADKQATDGFFDRIIANQIQRFGVMAHVYASYESRHAPGDAHPFVRGIKSFELLNSANRWYIVQVYYDWERPGNAIPENDLHDHML